MPNITEFLEARIAEDEAEANAAIANYAPDEWDNPTNAGNYYPADIAFWERQTPTRVLAECAAKRAIIEAHTEAGPVCMPCEHEWPCATIRAVASVYSDRPDYRQEWAIG